MKKITVNFRIEEDLLKIIDGYAESLNKSRTDYLKETLLFRVQYPEVFDGLLETVKKAKIDHIKNTDIYIKSKLLQRISESEENL